MIFVRALFTVTFLVAVTSPAYADAECKTAKDCARVGPACCSGECRAVAKKNHKQEKKNNEQACAVRDCARKPVPAISCTAPLICMEGLCSLGNVKAHDADQKKEEAEKKKAAEQAGKQAEDAK